ncbi:hypothetical protein GCM10023201_53220 [Actinomycetospora corticicola]|uniref:Gas vesicle protein GvpO n=1 Tax=Actinomycetospora corticicola TaxID=663602 RepID=A0A7Y9DXL8_9PSEU|nr:gas vesicle protein GvpO [Actinomycetospora corticicola]NYD37414.1 hypothetical protein [Actinomycetospora corticicola]
MSESAARRTTSGSETRHRRAAPSREDGNRSPAPGGREVLDAVRDLADDLGWQSEAVAGLRRTADGWTATVDVVETSRVPSTTDVIGVYEIDLDDRADMLGFRRLRHYIRGRGDNDRDH